MPPKKKFTIPPESPSTDEDVVVPPASTGRKAKEDEEEEDEEEDEDAAVVPDDERKRPAKKRAKKNADGTKGRAGRPPGSANLKGKKLKPPTGPGRKYYSELEDLMLCKAWVNVSQNSQVGTNQTGPTFWKKIQETFTALMDSETDVGQQVYIRLPNSLTDRFQRNIQKETTRFNGYLKQRKLLNESGKSEDDVMNDGLKDYFQGTGKDFKWVHCLDQLWGCPQFDIWEPTPFPFEKAASRASISSAGSGNLHEDDDEGDVINVAGSMQGTRLQRPTGNKAAKIIATQEKEKRHWNQQRDMRMAELAKINKEAVNVLIYSAHQSAISARVGHFVMLGQHQKAFDLLKETEHLVGAMPTGDDEVGEKITVNDNENDKLLESESEEEEEAPTGYDDDSAAGVAGDAGNNKRKHNDDDDDESE
jgi:hypothetical protein